MKKRFLALFLTAVLTLSLLGAAVFAADESGADADSSSAQAAQSADTTETAGGEENSDADPDAETETEDGAPAEEYIPDPAGTLSFANLERRMREGNLTLLGLEENILAIQSIDYDRMYEDLRKSLNEIASTQWMMITQIPMMGSMMASSMDAQYDALRETFDAIKEGELQQDNADLIWQLQTAQNQVVMAGQSLYIAIKSLEVTNQALDRSLEALDRQLQELELRYQLGHISSLTLEQAKAGRVSLVSGQQTLAMNLDNLLMQLELLIGAEIGGGIQLSALPAVTNAQLEEMNLEEDLAAAKEASYSLYDAKLTLDDAYEQYKDDGGQYAATSNKYEYKMAAHTYEAAKYTYNATVQNFELSFRTLYSQVKDCKQVLDAAKTALAVEQSNYSVAQLKYEQGNISLNDLLEAEDKVAEAQETVDSAAIDLFSGYNTYRWAVDYGIIN